MKPWIKISLAVMLVMIAILWFGIGYEVVARWNEPLGPALELPTYSPTLSLPDPQPSNTALAPAAALSPPVAPAIDTSTSQLAAPTATLQLFATRTPRAERG